MSLEKGPVKREPQKVWITEIDIPFFSLMWLVLKVIMAAIPAMIGAVVLVQMFSGVVRALFGGS